MSDQAEPPRDRCPRCGRQFDEVRDENQCPENPQRIAGEGCGLLSSRDELIGEDDDYEWVL